ncbi:MAG: hypothetical protein V1898_03130, partial [Patescibacteria group bacterium]
ILAAWLVVAVAYDANDTSTTATPTTTVTKTQTKNSPTVPADTNEAVEASVEIAEHNVETSVNVTP